ncbi:MAG TPA: methionyl-tRNA formyltransferase [Actinomycetota bacterium]|nr:methionyl-tRNA formyltransferase [Actinomycetota bacterium]
MRVVFFGNDPWSVPSLEAVDAADGIDIELVITNPPRPAGRGARLTPTAVAEAARRRGIPLGEVAGVRGGAGLGLVDEARPDAMIVVAYGEILPARVLDVPRLGTLNLHFSLLPRWRGAAPVQRAILEGDDITGVSVMLLDEGLDTGPVLASLEEPIHPDDDAGGLGERLARLGAPLLVEELRAVAAGTAVPIAQDDAAATYAAKPLLEERVIDWQDAADSIVRRVRAFAPTPGATTTFRDATLKVLRAAARGDGDASEEGASPGEIRVARDGVPLVTAFAGEVALLEVAPAGRARMPGADWVRGARLERGERCS